MLWVALAGSQPQGQGTNGGEIPGARAADLGWHHGERHCRDAVMRFISPSAAFSGYRCVGRALLREQRVRELAHGEGVKSPPSCRGPITGCGSCARQIASLSPAAWAVALPWFCSKMTRALRRANAPNAANAPDDVDALNGPHA